MSATITSLYKRRYRIPIPLSETACGNDHWKWRARLVLLRRQERRLRETHDVLGRELDRIRQRIATAEEAIETPPPPVFDHALLRRPMRADRTGGGSIAELDQGE